MAGFAREALSARGATRREEDGLSREERDVVLCVGPNPALQRTLWFKGLQLGEVNRAARQRVSGGGKGTNVARILDQLGQQATLFTFVGGFVGQELLQVLQAEGLKVNPVDTGQPTRVCCTLIDEEGGTQTEIVEEALPIQAAAVEQMVAAFEKDLSKAVFAVFSGTSPPGTPPDLYGRLALLAAQRGVPTIIDAPGQLLLKGVRARPLLAKPNKKELLAALPEEPGIDAAMRRLVELGARAVLVTTGPGQAHLLTEGELYRYQPPQVEAVNPIGSGDAVAAGVALATLQGKELVEAVRFGIACGTANALTELAGNVRPEDVERLWPLVKVQKVTEVAD